MRYELTDYEWAAITPMLPNKARGVPRVDDLRVLNGICWVLRSGAPWRDLPVCHPLQPFRPVAKGRSMGAGSWTPLPPLMMRPSK
jgi:transposase